MVISAGSGPVQWKLRLEPLTLTKFQTTIPPVLSGRSFFVRTFPWWQNLLKQEKRKKVWLLVVRNSLLVNRLLPQTEIELKDFEQGELNQQKRLKFKQQSIYSTPPTQEERDLRWKIVVIILIKADTKSLSTLNPTRMTFIPCRKRKDKPQFYARDRYIVPKVWLTSVSNETCMENCSVVI